jgi:hypothetical protein
LSEVSSVANSKNRGPRRVLFGAGVYMFLLFAGTVALGIVRISAFGGWESVNGVLLVVAIAGMGLTGFVGIASATKLLPGADEIRIGSARLELWSEGHPIRSWNWTDSQTSFRIEDRSRTRASRRFGYPSYFLYATHVGSRGNALTEEAFRRVIEAARAAGFEVISHPRSRTFSNLPITIYDVFARHS